MISLSLWLTCCVCGVPESSIRGWLTGLTAVCTLLSRGGDPRRPAPSRYPSYRPGALSGPTHNLRIYNLIFAVFRLIFFQNSISFKIEGVICFSGMIFTKRFPIRQALVRSYIYIFIRIPQDFCHFSCKPCTRGYKGFLDILGGSHMPIDLRFPSFRGTYHRTTSEEGGAGELKLSQGVPLPSSPLYKISFLK